MSVTLPRSVVVEAIEAGISRARFSGKPAEKLRDIGRTVERIGVGSFFGSCVGCPMVEARLVSWDDTNGLCSNHPDVSEIQAGDFAESFDGAIDSAARKIDKLVFDVVEIEED